MDTNINYPVVQSNDNSWFLNRNYKGDFATAGSLFLDYRNNNDFSDTFSVIYGHRMGNGEMFSNIQKFANRQFFDEHRKAIIKRTQETIHYSIIAYAEVKANDWEIYNLEYSHNRMSVIKKIIDNALIKRENTGAEKYVMLSTCDGAIKNRRDVLLLKADGV